MLTLLSKLFPYDICIYIYNLLIEDYINTNLIGKIYNNSLIMEKHNKKYQEIVIIEGLCYNPSLQYVELINACKFLKYVKLNFINKKYYDYDKYTKKIIKDFINIVEFICEVENSGYNIGVNKYLQPLIKELKT